MTTSLSLFRIFRIAFCKLMGDVTMTTSTSCIQSMVMVYIYLLHMPCSETWNCWGLKTVTSFAGAHRFLSSAPPHFPGVTCPCIFQLNHSVMCKSYWYLLLPLAVIKNKATWLASRRRQRLLFNGRALVSIRHWASGSHLPRSPPMQSETLNRALHMQNVGATCHQVQRTSWIWGRGGTSHIPP